LSDLILLNANIITLDPAYPHAQLVAIQNGVISALSTGESINGLKKKNTKVIDCKGKTILPGFMDAHFHLFAFAESFVTLNLEPQNHIRSIIDIQMRIQEFCQRMRPGAWIRGRGYNEFYLAEKRHPNRWDLDKVTTVHPIKVTHRSGQANILNSLGLKLVGISKETADPPGGLIDREIKTGEPTGILYGMEDLLAKAIPPLDRDHLEKGIKQANEELCSLGITSIHDASPRNNLDRWELIRHWKGEGLLKPRIKMTIGKEGFEEFQSHRFSTQGDENQVSLGGVKIILHETTGQLSPSQPELNEMVLDIHQSGLQAVLHAIEGETIEAACEAVERALQKLPRADHRHRIEHCSVCPFPLAKRIASLGMMVVTQPSFIFYNGDRYLMTVPDSNLKHLYPIATLMKNGVAVAGSSDCPVAPADPMIGIYSAISRKTNTGNALLHEEGISPVEALQMFTGYAARASFDEKRKGSVTPGKLADLVVLNGDPVKLPTEEIKNINVEMTVLNGEVVWRREGTLLTVSNY
jgi:predicted amidohydrolase YtcJ